LFKVSWAFSWLRKSAPLNCHLIVQGQGAAGADAELRAVPATTDWFCGCTEIVGGTRTTSGAFWLVMLPAPFETMTR
jgi:hypothetical protein